MKPLHSFVRASGTAYASERNRRLYLFLLCFGFFRGGAKLPKIAAQLPSTPPLFSPGFVIPGIQGKMCSSSGFVFGQLEMGPLTHMHTPSDLLIYGSQGNSRYAARIHLKKRAIKNAAIHFCTHGADPTTQRMGIFI